MPVIGTLLIQTGFVFREVQSLEKVSVFEEGKKSTMTPKIILREDIGPQKKGPI